MRLFEQAHRLARPELAAARAVGRELAGLWGLAPRLEPFLPYLWKGCEDDRPTLHLDDFSGLALLDGILGVEEYQHRARVRAKDGDLFAAVTPPAPGYESYCRERLNLGAPEFVAASAAHGPLPVARGLSAGEPFQRLVAVCAAAGGLYIHPFMGIEAVWELAASLESAAGAPVAVISPPPPVTWIANDKLRLSQLVAGVLGDSWLVEGRATDDREELVRILDELTGRHARVAVKRLRCVSGMGNAIYDSAELARGGPPAIAERVRRFAERTAWVGREKVLAVAWEITDHSPSTQLWIPPSGAGDPLLQGIYDQLLLGPRRVFAGSRPSQLPTRALTALGVAALEVAAALQELGYSGRCSFDHLLVGDPEGEFELRFVECNGRWGGSSTPMHLVDRLRPGPRPPYRAQDFERPELVGVTFAEVLSRLGDSAYDARTGRGRFILYNVGPLERFGKLDVIALGTTQGEAEEALVREFPSLLGVSPESE